MELFARNDVSMICRRHAEERFSQLLLFPWISIGWIAQSQSFRSNTGHHSTPPILNFTAITTKEIPVWSRLQTFSFFVMSLDGVFRLKSLAPSSNWGYFCKKNVCYSDSSSSDCDIFYLEAPKSGWLSHEQGAHQYWTLLSAGEQLMKKLHVVERSRLPVP